MTFALEMDTGTLWVFASPKAAMIHCEKYDIAEQGWAFFAQDGTPLEPRPESRRYALGMQIDTPDYKLDATMLGAGPGLISRLAEIRSIEGGPFISVEELRTYLLEGKNAQEAF